MWFCRCHLWYFKLHFTENNKYWRVLTVTLQNRIKYILYIIKHVLSLCLHISVPLSVQPRFNHPYVLSLKFHWWFDFQTGCFHSVSCSMQWSSFFIAEIWWALATRGHLQPRIFMVWLPLSSWAHDPNWSDQYSLGERVEIVHCVCACMHACIRAAIILLGAE